MEKELIYCSDFNFDYLNNFERIKKPKNKKSKTEYLDVICAFDIETTNIDSIRNSIMYIWQFQIEDITIIGRTWKEFQDFIHRLKESTDYTILCFIHNLSFEYQFMKNVLKLHDVLAMDSRKVLKCESDNIEFRCSYLHSNMSLEKYLEYVGADYQKVKGFDYSKKRYPWTELSDEELKYCIYDVKALVNGIRKEMERDGDNQYTFPLTSTSYVRREFRPALAPLGAEIRRCIPSLRIMQGLHSSFRGGNTGSNRYNTNRTIRYKSKSKDIASAHPYQLLSKGMPYMFNKKNPSKFERELKMGKACLVLIRMYDIHLKDIDFPIPYFAKSKCERISNDAIISNGRVLECSFAEMWINEIDFTILASEYEFEYEAIELYTSIKKKLPIEFRRILFGMFQQKTLLKGGDAYRYSKYKNLINAVFGMLVEWKIRPNYIVDSNNMLVLDDFDELGEWKKYKATGWLLYQWGTWCTSYTRLQLEQAIQALPHENVLYVDTDSIKYIDENDEFDYIFEELNKEMMNPELEAVDLKGNKHQIGLWEDDGEYEAFRTMGAKKYAVVEDGKLKVTIAGVNKKKGAEELKDIDNMKEGFIFKDAGGTESIYNDYQEMKKIKIQNHEVELTSNIAIYNSTYTLGLAGDYEKLLNILFEGDIRDILHYKY